MKREKSSDQLSEKSADRLSDQDLPDLTERLIVEGLHDEYLRYKAGYLAWRRGETQGSVGELQDIVPKAHAPSPQKFQFFFTTSYWVAVSFTMGALVLTFTSAALLFDRGTWHVGALSWMAFFGNIIFTVSAYLSYFELINSTDAESFAFLFFTRQSLRERGVVSESLVGVLAFLLGMVVYDVAAVLDLFATPTPVLHSLVLALLLLGSVGFFIGGACEVLHNYKKSRCLAWSASVSNLIAGALLVLSSIADLFGRAVFFARVSGTLGLAIYVVTGVLLIKMWEGNDFGLTLMHHINDAIRSGGHVSLDLTSAESLAIHHVTSPGIHVKQTIKKRRSKSMSTRGVAFLVIYCWLFACCTMNCAASAVLHAGKHLLDLVNSFLWLLVVSIVLLVHSAITRVPNQQPYHLAMICIRATLFFAALSQTIGMTQWLHRPPMLVFSLPPH